MTLRSTKNGVVFCKLMKIGGKTHIITSCGRRDYLKIVVRVDDLLLVQLVVLISHDWNLRGVSFCTAAECEYKQIKNFDLPLFYTALCSP